MISSLKIQFPEEQLADLKNRLSTARWPDEIKNSGWKYGAELGYMKELAEYWLRNFDWRAREKYLNSFPNYTAEIDGFQIHFVHVKGDGKNNIPLLLTHGWPGSFLEFLKMIPLLTNAEKFQNDGELAFDLVIPSMPGFGLSQRSEEEGMNIFKISELWSKLMTALGYEKFAAHGGDFGAGVSTALALKYPERMIGIHLNYIPGSYKPFIEDVTDLSAEEKKFLEDAARWSVTSGGYLHLQKTRPLTVAYGLNDSPIGLAAWLTEKFYEWGDCKGNIESRFSKDELLTNITLYWLTETIHSSCRLYVEGSKVPLHFNKNETIAVPCGIAHFPLEEPFPPRKFIERVYAIRHWTEMPSGGHFAALEEPELLSKDIYTFFSNIVVNDF